jgi:membrane protein required for colicin V production
MHSFRGAFSATLYSNLRVHCIQSAMFPFTHEKNIFRGTPYRSFNVREMFMSWLDFIIIGIIALSAMISLVRGFVKESISLTSWVVAGFIALRYLEPMAELLEPYISSPTIRTGSGFSILFVCTLIVGAIVNYMASQMVSKTGLSGTDKSLGVVFGAARGVLIVTMVVLLAGLTPIPTEPWWQESLMVEYFVNLSGWIKEILPQDIASRLSL